MNDGGGLEPLVTIFLELPLTIVKRADLAGLQPTGNAMKVKGVVANTPSDCAFFRCRRGLIGLTFNTEVHDVIATNGAVVNHDIPCPQSDGGPFLDFETLLTGARSTALNFIVLPLVFIPAHHHICVRFIHHDRALET